MACNRQINFYCRGSEGLWRVQGNKEPYEKDASFVGSSSSQCKCLEFSPSGETCAWCDGTSLKVYNVVENKLLHDIELSSVGYLTFSPSGSMLATWQVFTVKDKIPSRNMRIIDLTTGKEVASLIQKKAHQWAPQWSADEKICVRNYNNELQFFEENNFSEVKMKLHLQKVSDFSLAPNSMPYTVAAYVAGSKGLPSNVRVYQYPNIGGHGAAVASKSFFKAERVNLEWNSTGTAMLILTSTETSASSYYGEQGLHFLALNGDSCVVPLAKNGPVYSIAWHPSGTEFTVLYGYMPAKCTIFNLKNEAIFDFGTGPRNHVFYNPFGNILCLAGFGNLQGKLEFWDVKSQKLISEVSAKDSTYFGWAPDGCHAITATLSPRMRVGNGYKVWHYTGSLMKQASLSSNAELWQVMWSPVPKGTFSAPTISYTAVPTNEKAPAVNAAPAYRPPGARGSKAPVTKVHEYELPSNQKKAASETETNSAPLSKNQKRKRAKAAAIAKAAENTTGDAKQAPVTSLQQAPVTSPQQAPASSQQAPATGSQQTPLYVVDLTGDPEKDKRIKNLTKKLQQIMKLKGDLAAGVKLQFNQLEKLKKEDEIVDELNNISLS